MSTLSATIPFTTHPHFPPAPRAAAAAASEPSPHGKKRPADSSLENEQRLSKRFDLLNLDKNGSLLYIPVPGSSDPPQPSSSSSSSTSTSLTNYNTTQPTSLSAPVVPSKPKRHTHHHPPSLSSDSDSMDLDLDPSLSPLSSTDADADTETIESTPTHPIFLPDIEKHLSKIPTHVLRGEGREIHHMLSTTPTPTIAGGELQATRDNQLVLYSIPGSLTVPEEQDRVRRAIAEGEGEDGDAMDLD
ncbi:hypothetical protein BU24DRAFT_236968 [Aaosphaeria arxii CBS 175.79]|uniref:Uncharacterized protein n=1 Tax=Aaosphaeria arxii CBS 175.79 TaxID=1450172 RepID=A0A6A5XJF8_9PLEO|nr:uncharacterized protein BU24DRAFT_236968 [Aaosphaeria arxii CBS 175.79]KAF2013405.1 hypothetical protein BU24DRAFT_236968 [Aaosphaeria arxii CBS 175.79]